jgi:serine/threonine protein phosphatase PrpC
MTTMSQVIPGNTNHFHVAIKGNRSITPFIFSWKSIPCERHPERNEDRVIADEQRGIAAVFDGVGGSAAGEIASRTAAQSTITGWKAAMRQLQKRRQKLSLLAECEQADLCGTLEQLVTKADEQVRTAGAQIAGTDDLATTVAMAAFCRNADLKSYSMVYAHVGDSRIYLLREGQPIQRLTSDDGLLAKLVENQIVNESDALRIDQAMRSSQLTDTEYNYFRLRGGITQALGGPLPPSIHVNKIDVFPGDRILLCTDGIHDNLTDEEIEFILRSYPRTVLARTLIEHSVLRSHEERPKTIRAKPDDMSAVVLSYRY